MEYSTISERVWSTYYQSRRVVHSHKPRSSRQSDTTGIVVIIIQNNNGGGCGGAGRVGAGRVGGGGHVVWDVGGCCRRL